MGFPLKALGSITFTIMLGDISRRIDAQSYHRSLRITCYWIITRWLVSGAFLTEENVLSLHPAKLRCVPYIDPAANSLNHPWHIQRWLLLFVVTQLNTPWHCPVVPIYKNEIFTKEHPVVFEQIIVAFTLAIWRTIDGSVHVQVANPLSQHVALHSGLQLARRSPKSTLSTEQPRVHGVVNSPRTPVEIATVQKELT